jgi:hypothetical protein
VETHGGDARIPGGHQRKTGDHGRRKIRMADGNKKDHRQEEIGTYRRREKRTGRKKEKRGRTESRYDHE